MSNVSQQNMLIRDFILGEEIELRHVFMSSVHKLARSFYTEDQLSAWAPHTYDEQQWTNKMLSLRPFVAVVDARVAGYADLQESGYIDHFFVAGQFSSRGVGSALMARIHRVAAQRKISGLSAHVSLAAETFYTRHGFSVVYRQSVSVSGVSMSNALMTKQLLANNSFKPTPLRGAA